MKQSSILNSNRLQLPTKDDHDTEHVEASKLNGDKEASEGNGLISLVESKNLYRIARLHNIDLSKDKVRIYVRFEWYAFFPFVQCNFVPLLFFH